MSGSVVEKTPWVAGETIGSVLRRAAREYPDRDGLVFPSLGVRWSWAELNRRVDVLAAGLLAVGVSRGDHVGIWSMNVPEWVLTQFATARLGAVLVNINPGYRTHELEEALRAADVDTLVVGSPFKTSDFVGMVHALCPEVADAASPEWSVERLPALRRVVALEGRPGPGWLNWDDLGRAATQAPAALEAAERRLLPGDVFNIQFTSGTTGAPKGAMLTHHNLLMNSFYVGERLRYTGADRVCVPVPFYHCFGCVLGNLVCVLTGAAIVVPAPAFDPGATLAAIDAERCTSVYGVPTMFTKMLDHPDFARFDLSRVRTGIMAGAPCPLPLMQRVIERMGAREICIGYGQTEASPIITFTTVDAPIEVRVGTVGRPLPGVQVKLVDPVGRREVPEGEAGELCARGHNVMSGYYHNPEATGRAIDPEGWLHTGDMAIRREDGNYRIVGRCKELIIRGGENIYPPEVEEFLHHHPDVAEVAVIGLPDPRFGEIVGAWVVPRPGASLDAEGLRAYCQGQIAHFKIPAHFAIVPSLPRTVTGKVRKHVIRERAILDLGLGEATTA
jgi:fatty-acyl-CoA synthase